MKIFVTGIGVCSALGLDVESNIHALSNEKTGIRKGTQPFSERFLVGEIPYSNQELCAKFQLDPSLSRTAILGFIAAKEAFRTHSPNTSIRTGIISGTSVGGMDTSEVAYRAFVHGTEENLNQYREHPSGKAAEQIAAHLGIQHYVNTISTACSSAANAIMLGARMIQAGQLDRVLVGGTDALSEFTISGFRSLMIFDEAWCRPFDDSRKGLNLGEGAGFLVLESEASMKLSGSNKLARLSGWCNASDAYHQTASSPDAIGATLSMKGALAIAGINPEEIDYINAHGTATPNNDLSESTGILNVFGTKIPPFSSTKAYTGHTLAASGGIEAVYAVVALRDGFVYPNLNFSNPLSETGLIPQLTFEKGKIMRHILSNSFGFGGNNSTIILSAE
jgi:3-oxoacyl-[acyl-carrier-protein] synthase-1